MEEGDHDPSTAVQFDSHPEVPTVNLLTQSLTRWSRLGAVALLAAIALGPIGSRCSSAEAGTTADDGRGILRYKLVDDRLELVPISRDELKVGHIYSHFNNRLNRRVWSYLQANGQFWYAFGEGTTQEGWRLDIEAPPEELMEKLKQRDPQLAYAVESGMTVAHMRLTSNSRWEIASTASHPTIYNLETGQRWDWLSDRYVPVRSTYGYRWTVEEGRYVPVGRAGPPAHR